MRIRDITEARYQGLPLIYHSTYIEDASKILKSGIIKPKTPVVLNGKKYKGVSLTRSWWFATVYNDVVFGLDLNKARELLRGRMQPFADPDLGVDRHYDEATDEWIATGDHRREAEEFVIGPVSIQPLLVGIWISRARHSHFDDQHIQQLQPIVRHPAYKGLVKAHKDDPYGQYYPSDLKPGYAYSMNLYQQQQQQDKQAQGVGKPKKASSPVLPS